MNDVNKNIHFFINSPATKSKYDNAALVQDERYNITVMGPKENNWKYRPQETKKAGAQETDQQSTAAPTEEGRDRWIGFQRADVNKLDSDRVFCLD